MKVVHVEEYNIQIQTQIEYVFINIDSLFFLSCDWSVKVCLHITHYNVECKKMKNASKGLRFQ